MNDRKIEISRNIIENFLMRLKDIFRNNQKVIIYSSVSIVIMLALILSGVVYIHNKEQREIRELETIIDRYYSDGEKNRNLKRTIDELNSLIKSSLWGYVKENGYYLIAGLFLSENKYNEGREYLLKFVDESPSSFFAPLALHRAGVICEKLNDINGTFRILGRLEKEYKECIIADEIYYDIGRMNHKKGDFLKAKEYYNRVIKDYPMSIFNSKAKKRLFLLGYNRETFGTKK